MVRCTASTSNVRVGHTARWEVGCGLRSSLIGVLVAMLCVGPGVGFAEPPAPTQLPTGEQVVGGAATVGRQQATMTIDQSTSRAAIDWHSFDIGSQAQVNIRQPSTDSVLLNRIMGGNPSQIFGGLTANGQVYLSNPNGLYFAPSASVNVGGLVATTHRLSLEEFMAGKDRFTRNGATGRILNEGQLKASLGGYIALLASEVRNHGVIVAELGTVALAAGEAYELRFDPSRRLEGLRIEPSQIQALVENKQAVLAPGGLILLSAQGMSQLQGSVVRHDGTLEASSLVSKGGRILLEGEAITLGAQSKTAATGATGGGEVLVGGGWQGSGPLKHATSTTMEAGATIDVSATQRGNGGTAVLWSDIHNPGSMTTAAGSISARGGLLGGNGGRIETSGYRVDIRHARVTAGASLGLGGEWLIDPYNYTINGSAATDIVNALNTGTSVTVDTASNVAAQGSSGNVGDAGDITVSSAITTGAMTGDATLTLKAARHITLGSGGSIDATQNGNTARLNVKLWADSDNSGDGINIISAPTIATNGGSLTFGNGNTTTIGGQTVKVGGDVYFDGTVAQILNSGGGAITVKGETIVANGSVGGLTFNSGGGNIVLEGLLNAGNQYTYVDGPDGQASSWDWSRTAAKNGTAGGAATGDSYLVNISSRLENAIAGNAAGYRGAWIGAYRANPGGSYNWQWADGPESGQVFFVQSSPSGGTVQPGGYANFGTGEPNGALSSGGESRGQFFGAQGQWNDLVATEPFSASQASQYSVLGYVRETNLASSKVTINAGAGNFSVGGVGGGKTLSSLTVTAAHSTVEGSVLKTTGAQSFSSGLTVNSIGAFDLAGSSLSVGGPLSITATNDVTLGAPTTVAGGIDVSGAKIALYANLTSSATGNINLTTSASAPTGTSIYLGGDVLKTGGSRSTLTVKAAGRIDLASGQQITGTALDTVLWSDYDDTNNDGGVSILGSISTNGGHLWAGGSNSNGGNATWNGLTVGNGPSIGVTGYNHNAFDLFGPVATAGGDVLLWGGNAVGTGGTAGIVSNGSGSINAGSGHVTLIADQTAGAIGVTSTGTLSLAPDGGSYASALTVGGTAGSGNLALNTSAYNGLTINGLASLGGLSIGRYAGTGLVGDSAVSFGNTSDVTISSALGVAGPITVEGGTLNLNANLTTTNTTTGDVSLTAVTGVSGSGNIVLADGRTLTVSQSGNSTYSGVVSGTNANVVKAGTGDLSLAGAGTYGGNTTVSSGILSLAAADRLPDSTALTVNSGATFSLNGFNETVGSIAGSGLIVNGAVVRDGLVMWLDAGNTASYNGSGSTWYDLSGNGYHGTLVGSPIYNAGTSLFTFDSNTKYVQLAALPANFLGSTVTGLTVFTVANFGTAQSWERIVDLGNTPSPANTPSNNIILARNGTSSRLAWEYYNGTGAGATYTSIGNNTAITDNVKASYAGTADGANLRIFRDGVLNTTTASTALPSAIARSSNFIGKSNWIADETFRGDIGTVMVYNRALSQAEIAKNHQLLFNRSEATLTVGGSNANTTFAGQIENGVGTLNLVKQGSGTLTLTGANSYAGTTTVQAGMLRNGATDVVPRFSAASVASGATWDLNSFNNTVGSVAGAGNIPLGSGTLTTGGLNTSTTFSGVMSGTGGVSKSGTGTWTFSGANSYSGPTTVTGGTLASGATDTIPDSSAVTVNSGATLNLNGFTETLASLSGDGNVALGRAALTTGVANSSTTFTGIISGTGSLTKSGTGAWTLTGTNTYSGATTVAAGTLAVGNGGSTGTLGSGVVTTNAALVVNRSGNVALSAVAAHASGIGGTGSVNATAAGDLTIDRSIGVNGPVTLTASTGNLAINSAVTTTGSTITLTAGGTITDGVGGSLSASNLALLGGNVTLDNTAHTIGTLAANGVSTLTYLDSNALTIGTVGATSGISATGPVQVETLSGDLTVAQNIATTNTGTSAITLNAGKTAAAGTATGGNLLFSGSPTVTTGSGGRATLYSGGVSGSTGLTALVGSGRFRYNSDESTTNYTAALGSGLHAIYRESPSMAVTVEDKTITYGDASPTWTYTTSGLVNGDTLVQAFASPTVSVGGATSTSGSYVVGSHTLTPSGMATSQLGYAIGTHTNGTLIVNAKALTTSGLTASNKVYDGTTAATVNHSGVSFSGLVTGDTVTASGTTGSFANKHVGTGKTVTLSGTSYGGADAGNYTFTDQTSTTANITAKAATVIGLTASNKVYDGTTAATVNHGGASFGGLVAGDTVTASGTTGTFATKQVGSGKTVTLSGTTYAGADAGNYTFTDQTSTTANITSKPLTIDLQGQGSRVYDGTTTITLSGVTPTLTGVVSGDSVVVASGNVTGFVDKSAGINKAVSYSGFGISGADAGNYLLSTGSVASTASITPKAVTVSGLTATDKFHDGTTRATVSHSGASFSGLVAGDTVTASGTIGTFADAEVGSDKPVTLANTVYGGADAGNYVFTDQTSTSASIVSQSAPSQFQQPLGGITQLSRGLQPIAGSPSTMPPQSPPISGSTSVSTGGTGAVELARLFSADGLRVNWIREQSDNGTSVVTVSIPESMIMRGEPISFALPADLIKILQATPDQFTQADGNHIPAWLAYDQTVGNFKITDSAAIAAGPYEVVVYVNDQQVLLKIDKRSD